MHSIRGCVVAVCTYDMILPSMNLILFVLSQSQWKHGITRITWSWSSFYCFDHELSEPLSMACQEFVEHSSCCLMIMSRAGASIASQELQSGWACHCCICWYWDASCVDCMFWFRCLLQESGCNVIWCLFAVGSREWATSSSSELRQHRNLILDRCYALSSHKHRSYWVIVYVMMFSCCILHVGFFFLTLVVTTIFAARILVHVAMFCHMLLW